MKRSYPYTGPGGSQPPTPQPQQASAVDYSNYGYGGNQVAHAQPQQQQQPSSAPMTAEEQQAQWHKQWQQYYAQQAAAAAAAQPSAPANPPTQQNQPYGQPYPQQPQHAAPTPYYQGQPQNPYPQPQIPQQQSNPYQGAGPQPQYPQQVPPQQPYAQPRPPYGPQQPQQQHGPPASYYPAAGPSAAKRPRFDGNNAFSPGSHQAGAAFQQPSAPQQSANASYGWPGAANAGHAQSPVVAPMAPARGGRGTAFAGPARPMAAPMANQRGGPGIGRGGPPGGPGRGGFAGPSAGLPMPPTGPQRGGMPSGPSGRGGLPAGPSRGGHSNNSGGPRNVSSGGRQGFSSQNSIPTGNKNRYNQGAAGSTMRIPSGPSNPGTPAKSGTPTRSKAPLVSVTRGASNAADQHTGPASKRTFTDFRITRITIPGIDWSWDIEEDKARAAAKKLAEAEEAKKQEEEKAAAAANETSNDSDEDGDDSDEESDGEDDGSSSSEDENNNEDGNSTADKGEDNHEDKSKASNEPGNLRQQVPKGPAVQQSRSNKKRVNDSAGGSACRLRFCFAAIPIKPPAGAPKGPSADRKAAQASQQSIQGEKKRKSQEMHEDADLQTENRPKADEQNEANAESEEATATPTLPSSERDAVVAQAAPVESESRPAALADEVIAAASEAAAKDDEAEMNGIETALGGSDETSEAAKPEDAQVKAEEGDAGVASSQQLEADSESLEDKSAGLATAANAAGEDESAAMVAAASEDGKVSQETVTEQNADAGTQVEAVSSVEGPVESTEGTEVAETAAETIPEGAAPAWSPYSVSPPQGSPNRLSLSYAGTRSRIIIDAEVVKAVRVFRAQARIEIDVAVTTAGEGTVPSKETEKEWLAWQGVMVERRETETDHFAVVPKTDLEAAWQQREEAQDGDTQLKVDGGDADENKAMTAVKVEGDAGLPAPASKAHSAVSESTTMPPLFRIAGETEMTTIVVSLDKSSQQHAEAKWLKTGDVEEWLAALPGFSGAASADSGSAMHPSTSSAMMLASPWHGKISVADPDPPPTMQDVFADWSSKSFMGSGKDRRRFIREYLATSRGQVEILCRLVRGERASAVSLKEFATLPGSSKARRDKPNPLGEAAKRTAFASHQTHLSLAVLALYGLAEDFAQKSGTKAEEESGSTSAAPEPWSKDFDESINDILISMPQNLVFRALDGMWKEVLEKNQREKHMRQQSQAQSSNRKSRHGKKGKGSANGGGAATGGRTGSTAPNEERTKKEGSVASSNAAGAGAAESSGGAGAGGSKKKQRRRSSNAVPSGEGESSEAKA